MFEKYSITSLSTEQLNKGISKAFIDSFKAISELSSQSLHNELACCYHLAILADNQDDIKRLGYRNISDFASDNFGFKGSSVRNYVAVGKACHVQRVGMTDYVLSCYADENGNDFTRNQLNAIMSITEAHGKTIDFNHATPKQRACYNFKYLLDYGAIKYSDTIDRLKRVRAYLLKLGEYNHMIDSIDEVNAFTAFVSGTDSIESYAYDNDKCILALPAPTDPAPTDPKPDDPKPDEPKPDEPKPAESAKPTNEELLKQIDNALQALKANNSKSAYVEIAKIINNMVKKYKD